ncbi:MAG: DUF4426 domain-containing protein [Bermanella sp.]|jgi:hypothetical protein
MKGLAQFSWACMLLVGCLSWAHGEQKQVFADYEVHYIGLTSTELSPQVAKQYAIKRSRNMGYLSVSILKKGRTNAVDAEVSGQMVNLLGQYKTLDFTRIQEGRAIYFISTFKFDEEEVYSFDIDLMAKKPKKALKLKFKQRFYQDK